MVVFDASFLITLLDEKAASSVPKARERVRHLVNELEKADAVIIVPTPALCEVLVGAKAAASAYLKILAGTKRFRVAAFDALAAVEAAIQTAAAIQAGDKKGGVESSWQKVKFDRQIIAIAAVAGVSRIYSDDPHLKKLVGPTGPQVIALAELPPPPEGAQINMDEIWAPDSGE